MKGWNERFTDFADWVSAAMGTPLNIGLWLLAVGIWFIVFAVRPDLQNVSFMPTWFTSQSFNFPLNTVTTLAELYIGFLIAAASNRTERRMTAQQDRIESLEKMLDEHINVTAKAHTEKLDANTALTREIHRLVSQPRQANGRFTKAG